MVKNKRSSERFFVLNCLINFYLLTFSRYTIRYTSLLELIKMEEQKSNSKIVLFTILSCTKNIALLVLGIYLLYLLVGSIINNWNDIGSAINNVWLFLTPAYNFLLKNIWIILATTWILTLWLFCIICKLEDHMRVPSIFTVLFIILLLSGILLLLMASSVTTGGLSFICAAVSLTLLVLFGLCSIFYICDRIDGKYNHKDNSDQLVTSPEPEQLELFDDKK